MRLCLPTCPRAACTCVHHPPHLAADEVAWLFNLRGGDVPYNPVFISYGVLTADAAHLYVDAAKVTPE